VILVATKIIRNLLLEHFPHKPTKENLEERRIMMLQILEAKEEVIVMRIEILRESKHLGNHQYLFMD
jgi:hypothetical protein